MKSSPGQAVLIVLLSMVIVLTVVLSVIASSTSDIKLGASEGESLRAFSAAESGIEQALITNAGNPNGVSNGATYTTTVSNLAQGTKTFIYPSSLTSGDIATFWFVSHGADGGLGCGSGSNCYSGSNDISVCWGTPGTSSNSSTTPAVEVSIYYLATPGDYRTTRVAKQAYDPNTNRRSAENSYGQIDNSNCTIGSTSFEFKRKLDINGGGSDDFRIPGSSYNFANGLQFMSIKTLYNTDVAQPVGIDVTSAASSLPAQGSLISSTGNQNGSTRKIEVKRNYNQVPSVFDAAIYSPNTLAQ